MQLEDYFDLENPNGIRIKGTRINLEVVVREMLSGQTPDEIVKDYPSLSSEQVHAALTYFYRNRTLVEEYMGRQEMEYKLAKAQHESGDRPEIVKKLLAMRHEGASDAEDWRDRLEFIPW